jgi:hypothetical protein
LIKDGIRIGNIALRIRILLFSSVAFQMPTKKFFCLLLSVGRYHSHKLRSHKTVEIKAILLFLLVDGRIRIRTNKDGSGSGRTKNITQQFFHIVTLQASYSTEELNNEMRNLESVMKDLSAIASHPHVHCNGGC